MMQKVQLLSLLLNCVNSLLPNQGEDPPKALDLKDGGSR